jgi:hypothetical protein
MPCPTNYQVYPPLFASDRRPANQGLKRYLYHSQGREIRRGRIKDELVLDIANKRRNTPAVLREMGDGDCKLFLRPLRTPILWGFFAAAG